MRLSNAVGVFSYYVTVIFEDLMRPQQYSLTPKIISILVKRINNVLVQTQKTRFYKFWLYPLVFSLTNFWAYSVHTIFID